MHNVHISGYKKDELPFIPLLILIRELSDMSFADARKIVDYIWANETAEISFVDLNVAQDFIKKAAAIGVSCVLG
ncbi:hypothetical protein [Chitinophaga nivalis]|uniref:Ribosomal protein L7/L12 C-terminal domain-containing protein n=1 Tax=Chitinophaga nivalis TaxID=2991709 RepID=A0ABT3IQT3_9BACT|nr:hypothetical protein [Chitinophaga nivalis]MCW3463968.1 hypothetical protein [Chitinophaga nivalis]MCW3486342.1 hypothetical protein [Chitinophaga nivalis]